MEIKTVWVSGFRPPVQGDHSQVTSNTEDLDRLFKEGWKLDPFLMPTGRPNVVEGRGAIYHLIKLPDDKAKATEELIEYFKSQPATDWGLLVAKEVMVDKMEVHLLETKLLAETPMPVPEEVAYIIEVQNKEEDMKAAYDKGYRVVPDKIYQKTTVMRLMAKNLKPVEETRSGSPAPTEEKPP
jgi:hypothetical protein